jgi:hypothetical protein
MELFEDAGLFLRSSRELTILGGRGDAHLASVGELDGNADEVEEPLREALLVTQADRQVFGNIGFERELLSFSQ